MATVVAVLALVVTAVTVPELLAGPAVRTVAAMRTPPRPHHAGLHRAGASLVGEDGPEAAWVVAENARPGTRAWEIHGTPPGRLAGFASRTSAPVGGSVELYVDTDGPSFRVQAYRMGWYQGDGARLVWSSGAIPGQAQPTCPVQAVTDMVACDDWSPSYLLRVTSAFVQGDYLLKLVGPGGRASYIPLTVTDPSSRAAIVVKNDVYTWQAWNPYGGYDLYTGLGACAPTYPPCNRSRVMSFDRPYGYGDGAGDFLGQEYGLVRLMERHGLDLTYVTDIDVQEHPQLLAAHRVVLSLGHDECWSLGERRGLLGAVARGVNVIFFGASPILRHVRAQASPLGPEREMVDYRDSAADPLDGIGDPREVTGNTWSDAPASWSEVPFVGSEYTGYVEPGQPAAGMVVTQATSWLYRGTGLQDGAVVPGVIFGDFDQYVPGTAGAPVEVLAHTPLGTTVVQTSVPDPASDVTYTEDPASGAGIFDTGSTTWIPMLGTSPLLRRMTGNLLGLFASGPAARLAPVSATGSGTA